MAIGQGRLGVVHQGDPDLIVPQPFPVHGDFSEDFVIDLPVVGNGQ